MNEELKIKLNNAQYPRPTQNSPLKKKLTLLNKLKNNDTNYQSIIPHFIPENMSKFLPEISANILYNLPDKNIEDLLHIINYFKIYDDFLTTFVNQIKDTIKANIDGNIFFYIVLYYELMNYFIETKSLHKIINKINLNECVKLFVYLSKDARQKEMIINYCIENKEIMDDYIEQIKIVFSNYDEEVLLKKHFMERNFVKVIEPEEKEFDFYEQREVVDTEYDINYLLENIDFFSDKPELIDAIARKVTNEKIILKDVFKHITKRESVSVLARLVINFEILPKFIVYLESSTVSLPFLCELSKHRKYSFKNIIKVLEDSIKTKNTSKIICILNHCARIYLHRPETNHLMRKALEKIGNLKNETTGCDRIEISNSMSKIFSTQDISNIDGYLSNCDIKKLDKNIIFILAMKPWIFSDDRLVDAINEMGLFCLLKLTEENVFLSLYDDKLMHAQHYAKFYSKFGYNIKFVNKIMESDISNSKKAYVLMTYIEDIEKGCVSDIDILVEECSGDVQSYWANYKVKYGIDSLTDDFEEQIKKLSII